MPVRPISFPLKNVLGILNKGLLIAPIEAESSGNKYGNGIYLSDSFDKALDYCSGNKMYVLVVDTFLDKPFKISEKNRFKDVKTLKKNRFNCLINDTKVHITEERIYFINGTSVPISIIEEKSPKDKNYYYDYEPEYVIYDTKLVNVKYIIELED
jgi:poly [ADP-ribose] polymerase